MFLAFVGLRPSECLHNASKSEILQTRHGGEKEWTVIAEVGFTTTKELHATFVKTVAETPVVRPFE